MRRRLLVRHLMGHHVASHRPRGKRIFWLYPLHFPLSFCCTFCAKSLFRPCLQSLANEAYHNLLQRALEYGSTLFPSLTAPNRMQKLEFYICGRDSSCRNKSNAGARIHIYGRASSCPQSCDHSLRKYGHCTCRYSIVAAILLGMY